MDESSQLLLWRWSTIVQLASMATAAAFFVMLARANRRAELSWWARAWLANVVALVLASLYWQFEQVPFAAITALYMSGKAAFVAWLFQGAWSLVRPGARLFRSRTLLIGLAVYAGAAALLLRDLAAVGVVQHVLMGLAMPAFAVALVRTGAAGVRWLAVGIALRGLLAIVEAAAFSTQLADGAVFPQWAGLAAAFLATSSLLDTGAEWLIALSCVLALSDRARRELEDTNRELLAVQEDLRRLADRDPLTGATNRRALREIFHEVQPGGAMLLFFDLDSFKQINDVHGHAAGDTCLKLFATALKESFRPSDHVIRYGGDEFLVVASGLDRATARARVENVSDRLQSGGHESIVCTFSVGMARLEPDGQPEAALQEADQDMYKTKHRVRT